MPLSTIAGRNNALIRKALDAVVFAAPLSSTAPTSLTTGAGADLTALPAGYESLGWHTKDDGLNWTRAVETSDVTSHGSFEPTRRDIISDVSGLTMTAQETKMITLEMFHNIDLSAVTPTAVTGEIAFNRATSPATKYYRVLAVSQDGAGTDAWYFARFCPRAMISEYGEQAWTDGAELSYALTFTATLDATLGYSLREMWGGPAFRSALVSMGFPAL